MILQRKVNMSENIQILVVDDNQINRQYFSMALNKFGFNVSIAESGFEAIEFAKQNQFDLIFMDIRMPEMDGTETATKIRSLVSHHSTPILAISAENISENNSQIFNGFILKPVSPLQLKHSIEKFCSVEDEVLDVFDKEKALKYAYNDKDIMHKLIAMFLKELPEQLERLEESINISNPSESRHIIHKLRGSCQTCGAMVLNEDLKKLSLLINQNINIDDNLDKVRHSVSNYIDKFS